MFADVYPDLSSSNPSGPCPEVGWPTFAFHAETSGYEATKHIGPVSVKWVSAGTETYVVQGVPMVVDAEHLLILPDGLEYESYVEKGTKTTSLCAFFSRSFVEQHLVASLGTTEELLSDPSGVDVSGYDVMPQIVSARSPLAVLMTSIKDDVQRQADALVISQDLSQVLGEVISTGFENVKASESVPARKVSTRREVYRRLLLAKAYMEANCTRSMTLPEIAEIAWMSPYHFLRTFRAVTGQTPFQYICSCRIERAKALLRSDQGPIMLVAEEVGYESPTSFHAAFRRYTGETPDHFRRRTIRNLEERKRP